MPSQCQSPVKCSKIFQPLSNLLCHYALHFLHTELYIAGIEATNIFFVCGRGASTWWESISCANKNCIIFRRLDTVEGLKRLISYHYYRFAVQSRYQEFFLSFAGILSLRQNSFFPAKNDRWRSKLGVVFLMTLLSCGSEIRFSCIYVWTPYSLVHAYRLCALFAYGPRYPAVWATVGCLCFLI